MSATPISRKIARLAKGGVPRVLDLFAGCGGLSLGFEASGFLISAAVEFDPDAAASHGANFHPGDRRHSVPRDITRVSPSALVAELELGDPALAFDIIVGGPPCQAFARVGRSKLREVAEHPEAFRHDPRSRLYIEYLNYVDACQPVAVVIENVPDMLNHGGHNLADEIADVLSSRGYVCGYSLLNAAFYGVPQMRERMFLVAIRRELTSEIRMPDPTHFISLPSGYEGSRSVALKLLKGGGNEDHPYFVETPQASAELPRAISAAEAVGDLPAINARDLLRNGTLKRGARRFDQLIPYENSGGLTAYAQMMRRWPGHEGDDVLRDHVIRYLPRDYELFARLEAGDQYPQAVAKAELMLSERLQELTEAGVPTPQPGSLEWERLRAQIVPPYDPGKFPNKWRKMEADQPSRTLLAHLGKDGYSHIHYDSAQARTISVREAARLQSFPDGFRFSGTMNPAFKQIGNAVPPLLAKAVATKLLEIIVAGLSSAETRMVAGRRW